MATETSELIRMKNVGAYLSVSEKWGYKFVKNLGIEMVKIGGRQAYVRKHELDAAVEARAAQYAKKHSKKGGK